MTAIPAAEILAGVRLLLTDVDGVLTDGRIHFDGAGTEFKTFHVHDGAGLVYWNRSGGISGFLSGRSSQVVRDRAAELGVQEVHLGHLAKVPILEEIVERRGLRPAQVAYVGDDLLDLPVLSRVGFAAAPANARPEVKAKVHYVTETRGGEGVVREVIEVLLKAQGKWDAVVRQDGLP